MTNCKYYEGYDSTCDEVITKLHKHRENAFIEMLDYLGVTEEEYYFRGAEEFVYVREV